MHVGMKKSYSRTERMRARQGAKLRKMNKRDVQYAVNELKDLVTILDQE